MSAWIEPGAPAWQACLEKAPHDFYHLPAYVTLTARQTGAEPVAFYAESGSVSLLVPLHLQELPDDLGPTDGLRDAVSPYGYPTPLLVGPEGEREARAAELMSEFVEAARTAGIVSVFLRLHPLLPLPEPALRSVGTLVEHGPTAVIGLSDPVAQFWTETNNGHRLGIRKAEKAGFVTRFDHWEAFDDFIEIYRLTMQHVNATTDYFFDKAYFEGLRDALGEHLHLCTVHAPDGRVAAAGLFPEVSGLVQNHLSGTHPDFRKNAPSKLMLHSTRMWAAERGYRQFHLGGGFGGREDSLFAFKAGFTKGRATFQSLRLVVDTQQNARLTQAWARRHSGGLPTDNESATDFFPAYRRPAPVSAGPISATG